MKSAIIAFVFFAIFFGHFSMAGSDVNLYENPDSPLVKMPIYDQGGLGICYAYSAAQLIDFKRLSDNPALTDFTSPLWIALIHKASTPIHWNPDRLEHSRMVWAIDSVKNHGICDPAIFGAAMDRLRNGNFKMMDPDVLLFYEALWDKYQSNLAKLEGPWTRTSAYRLAYQEVSEDEKFSSKIDQSLLDSFSFMTDNSLNDRMGTLLEVAFAQCNHSTIEKIDLPATHSMGTGSESKELLQQTINETLDMQRPIGVGYCSNIYHDNEGDPEIRLKLPRLTGILLSGGRCSPHYSLVVGKRPNVQNGTDYLIRNSYGTGFWTKNYTCYCESMDPLDHGARFDCKADTSLNVKVLGCWIDADKLTNATYDLTRFEK